jgi:aminoglycoside phosphotransferase (APT) family kinase protein
VRDLVHGDFHTSNLFLTTDGSARRNVSVIDVEALGRGTRFHDAADLAAHCILWDGHQEALHLLNAYARKHATAGEWEISLAARLYEMLCFYITHRPPEQSEVVLQRAMKIIQEVQDTADPP